MARTTTDAGSRRCTGSRPALPVAASTAIRPLIDGPAQPVTVAGTPRGAVYLRTGAGRVIAVLAPHAARLPLGAVAGHADNVARIARVGVVGSVGGGSIELGGLTVRAVRWWDPRPALSPVRPPQLAAATDRVGIPGDLEEPCREAASALGAAVSAADAEATRAAARRLAGLGTGLTPAGDDVLIGLLSSLVCLRHAEADRLVAAVCSATADRTTDLSLALLRHAAAGECIGAVGDLLRALTGRGDLEPARRALLAVGQGSGSALLHGVLLGAAAVARATL